MATCKECGKVYLTKVCVSCREKKEKEISIRNNNFKKNIYKTKKENNMVKSLVIIIGIVSLISGTGYWKYKNIQLKEINEIQKKEIANLKYENVNLKKRVKRSDELVYRYQKINKQLVKNKRNHQNNNFITKNKKTKNITIKQTPTYKKQNKYIKPKKYSNNQTYKKQTIFSYDETKKYKNKNSKKKYHRYSGYKKLISDSKITVGSDNRLHSNAPIYAIYKYRLINKIDCNLNQNLYKVVDECKSYAPYSADMLYFSKSNKRSLQNFSNTQIIRCDYSKEHGLMHNCKITMNTYG